MSVRFCHTPPIAAGSLSVPSSSVHPVPWDSSVEPRIQKFVNPRDKYLFSAWCLPLGFTNLDILRETASSSIFCTSSCDSVLLLARVLCVYEIYSNPMHVPGFFQFFSCRPRRGTFSFIAVFSSTDLFIPTIDHCFYQLRHERIHDSPIVPPPAHQQLS